MSTHYEALGVSPDADEKTIAKAYRKAARRLHPDMNGGEHSPGYLVVAEAFEVLSDPEARREYDASLRGEEPPAKGKTGSPDEPVYTQPEVWQPAPEVKVSYVNPKPVPWWVSALAAAGLLGGCYMQWLAVNIPFQVHDHQPGCDLAVLAASIVALVVMFAAKGTSLTGGLIVAGRRPPGRRPAAG